MIIRGHRRRSKPDKKADSDAPGIFQETPSNMADGGHDPFIQS
jgi:hypothetical protein